MVADVSLASRPASPRILIAVPVFNEIEHLPTFLPTLRAAVDYDVLFVDDASTDGTAAVLEGLAGEDGVFLLTHATNGGYGKALIDAFAWADRRGYDWVITLDCDEQHDPASIPAFVEAIGRDDADLISGTRYLRMPGEDDGDLPPAERRAVNLILTATINELFGWSLTDTFCGFKAHRVRPTIELGLTENGYAFPMQLWPRAYAAGLRVSEIPVRRIYNDPNRTFGHDVRAGDLDKAQTRLKHYLDVLRDELCDLNLKPLRRATAGAAHGAIDALPDTVPGDLRDQLRGGVDVAAAVPC